MEIKTKVNEGRVLNTKREENKYMNRESKLVKVTVGIKTFKSHSLPSN